MDSPGDLPGTVGAVLDPVLALRTTLTIPAGQSASVVFTTFHAIDREDSIRRVEQFADLETVTTLFESASPAEPSSPYEAVYQDLAALLLFGAKSDNDTPVGSKVKGDRRDLLTLGLTGELPILLARIGTSRSSGRVAELVDLHRYWSLKKIECDLVIITDDTRGSGKLRGEVASLVSPGGDAEAMKKAGGIFVFDVSEVNSRQAAALNAAARIQIDCDLDTLAEAANG
jgi:cellobiose phosphorylase